MAPGSNCERRFVIVRDGVQSLRAALDRDWSGCCNNSVIKIVFKLSNTLINSALLSKLCVTEAH